MEFEATARLAIAPVPVFGYVQDLSTYPSWFRIVQAASPTAVTSRPAWLVELGAGIGPFRRTKQVRMVRTVLDAESRRARFERDDDDGRRHSAWTLDALVTDDASASETGGGCRLTMRLHYGGVAWLPGFDVLLREEARRAGGRLERLLAEHGHA